MSNAGSRDFGLKTKGLAKTMARQKVCDFESLTVF